MTQGYAALACYVFADGCTAPPARACRSRRRFTVTLPALRPGVRATLAGRPLKLRRLRDRRLRGVVDLRGRPRGTVTLRVRGTSRAGRGVTITRRYRTCGG